MVISSSQRVMRCMLQPQLLRRRQRRRLRCPLSDRFTKMAYTPFALPLALNKVQAQAAFDGDHIVISQDQSVFREGSHSMLIAGSATATIWGICGSQPVMKYWCHNTALDANGNFQRR